MPSLVSRLRSIEKRFNASQCECYTAPAVVCILDRDEPLPPLLPDRHCPSHGVSTLLHIFVQRHTPPPPEVVLLR